MATDQISEMVRTTLEAQIVQAFRDTPEAIDQMIAGVLREPVTSYGEPVRPDNYGRKQEGIPYLTWAARNTVRGIAEKTIIEHIRGMEDSISAAVRAKLQEPDVVDAYAKAILASVAEDWRITVNFNIAKD